MPPASKAGEQLYSDIHFYYHGVGGQTKYEGTKNLSYLQGSPDSHVSRVNITATKNESITNDSATGIVTSTPGTYTVTISVTATVTGAGKKYPIQESFQIIVKSRARLSIPDATRSFWALPVGRAPASSLSSEYGSSARACVATGGA